LPQGPGAEMPRQSKSDRSAAPMHKRMDAKSVEKQLQLHGRKKAMERWAENKLSGAKKPRAKSSG